MPEYLDHIHPDKKARPADRSLTTEARQFAAVLGEILADRWANATTSEATASRRKEEESG